MSDEKQELVDLLAELVRIPGPSGYEEPMIRWCVERFQDLADAVEVDVRGNVCACIEAPKADAPKLMLAAHMDTLGMIVKSIDEKGFIRFARETLPLAMCSRRVLVHGSKGPILGVIGIRIGYGTSEKEDLTKAVGANKLYIDVGCASAEEVGAIGIKIGDPITFDGELERLGQGDRIVSQYLDNRAGVATLVKLASRLRDISPRPEVLLVATIEEELGLRGASTAAYRLQPDLAISIDTQPAGGTPEYDFHRLPILIGKGPVVKFTENARVTNHPRVRQLLIDAAEKAGMPYQLAAAPPGGTDIGAIEQAGAGVPAAAIGLPRRYSHSPNEVIDLNDLMGLIRTLEEAVRILGKGYSLQRV